MRFIGIDLLHKLADYPNTNEKMVLCQKLLKPVEINNCCTEDYIIGIQGLSCTFKKSVGSYSVTMVKYKIKIPGCRCGEYLYTWRDKGETNLSFY